MAGRCSSGGTRPREDHVRLQANRTDQPCRDESLPARRRPRSISPATLRGFRQAPQPSPVHRMATPLRARSRASTISRSPSDRRLQSPVGSPFEAKCARSATDRPVDNSSHQPKARSAPAHDRDAVDRSHVCVAVRTRSEFVTVRVTDPTINALTVRSYGRKGGFRSAPERHRALGSHAASRH